MATSKSDKKMRSYRLSPEDLANIERLARAWGGLKPLDGTAVVSHALRLAAEGLDAAAEKKPKKSRMAY